MKILYVTTTFPRPNALTFAPWALERALNFRAAGADIRVSNLVGDWHVGRDSYSSDPQSVAQRPQPYKDLIGDLPVDQISWPLFSGQPGARLLYRRWPQSILWPAWRGARHKLKRIVDEFRPDLLLSNTPYAGGYAACRLREETGLPLVMRQEDLVFFDWTRVSRNARRLAADTYRTASLVMPVADLVAKEIRAISPDANVVTVNDGIAPIDPQILAQPRTGTAGNDLDSPAPGQIVYFCASDFTPRKDQPHLVEAFADAVKADPQLDLVLRLAGTGEELERVKALAKTHGIESRVKLLGRVPRHRVMQEVAWSDVVILPSYREPLATILIEGLAGGKPTISTADGGMAEAIEDGVHGYVVPPRDRHALAQAILKIAREPDQRQAMGRAAYALFDSRFRKPIVGKAMYEAAISVVQPSVVPSAGYRVPAAV